MRGVLVSGRGGIGGGLSAVYCSAIIDAPGLVDFTGVIVEGASIKVKAALRSLAGAEMSCFRAPEFPLARSNGCPRGHYSSCYNSRNPTSCPRCSSGLSTRVSAELLQIIQSSDAETDLSQLARYIPRL